MAKLFQAVLPNKVFSKKKGKKNVSEVHVFTEMFSLWIRVSQYKSIHMIGKHFSVLENKTM